MNSNTRRVRGSRVLAILIVSALAACGKPGELAEHETYPAGSMAAILATDERFERLMEITERDMPPVALESMLAPQLDITIFAPTDDAFAALPPGVLEWLRSDDNVSELQRIFDHHVVATSYTLDELRSEAQSRVGEIESLIDGWPIQLTLAGEALKVDEATVVEGDIRAENGVIHAIDTVLIPDTVPSLGT